MRTSAIRRLQLETPNIVQRKCETDNEIWIELPADIKNIVQKNKHVFIKKIKEFLHVNQK